MLEPSRAAANSHVEGSTGSYFQAVGDNAKVHVYGGQGSAREKLKPVPVPME